jgi:hypothetical protein
VLPGAFPAEVIEQSLRRIALALAAGDVARAHRALNDSIASARITADRVTEATRLSETDLFDITIESALEHVGVVTVGDLLEISEDELYRRCQGVIGHSLGRSRLAIVYDVRRKVRRAVDKSADSFATRERSAS